MGKDHQSINQDQGLRQTAGFATVGTFVYFILPDGSPNAGLPRHAVVTRMYEHEDRNDVGTLPEDVDLDVSVRSEDGVAREQTKIPHSSVGTSDMGSWRWQEPRESGF